MKKVFIVNSEQGTRVITENVLATDLKKNLNKPVKRVDVELFAKDAVDENNGRALNGNEYDTMVSNYCRALEEFAELTPYSYYKQL